MRTPCLLLALSVAIANAAPAAKPADPKPPEPKPAELKSEEQVTKGSVTGARRIDYTAIAGTLVVHPKGADEAEPDPDDKGPGKPAAAMSFVAYLAGDGKDVTRPLTFIYNGGPGSATMWLHLGAFGPRRVVTADDRHTPAAPYQLVDNRYCLLDATDLVFIDAPGTGFGKVAGKDKDKAFFGVEQDADAFADFITQFLTKHGRWNSPKYLMGESYGTTRSAVLANKLENDKSVDLAGVILISQILAFDNNPDGPESNPGAELPYQLALPTYAATAWYHKKLPDPPASFDALLAEVESFAMTDYASALAAGSALDPKLRKTVIDRLHHFTGLPAAYLDKANLRVTGGEFEKMLQDDAGLTTGRLDSRFTGPNMDPLSKEADYDPQQAALAPAYVSAYNDYARRQLKFSSDTPYKPSLGLWSKWTWSRSPIAAPLGVNVMPDLAAAMKVNPSLRVQLHGGYYDIATPFYQAVYELHHLPIPAQLQHNIETHFYPAGHMMYANEPSLRAMHDHVATFIRAGKR